MQFSNSVPIYLQVMEDMKREMVTGGLPAGSRVDSVRVLAARYGINLNTMRVCSELEREGLLETRRGVGSFVTGNWERLSALREEMARILVESYLKGMAGLGFSRLEAAERLGGEEGDGGGQTAGDQRAL